MRAVPLFADRVPIVQTRNHSSRAANSPGGNARSVGVIFSVAFSIFHMAKFGGGLSRKKHVSFGEDSKVSLEAA